MNDIQEALETLRVQGWTDAAIADAIGSNRNTVSRWRSGTRYPAASALVKQALDRLAQRKAPKQKRYAPGSRG